MTTHSVHKVDEIFRRRLEDVVYESAFKNANKTAIIAGTQSWTYRQLIRYAEKVAGLLRSKNVRKGEPVGVSATRQPETLGCLLGILRAGAVYVPLDPAYPLERIRFIIEDAGLNLLLSAEDMAAANLGQVKTITYKEIDSIKKPDKNIDPGSFKKSGNANDGIYILYTSGSSGRPKGVSIQHGNLINFLFWARKVLGDDALKGVLASTSFSFDISAIEIWLPLLSGGTVVIVKEANQFHDLKNKKNITLINTVPSVMIDLLTRGGLPDTLKTVCLGGEALPRSLADSVYQYPVERVFNLYGPTETTVYSSYKLIERNKKSVSIGKPIANTSLYVLDAELKVVPDGESGELYIGGVGVGTGYLNRPELTAQNFIPDPFAANKKSFLYRTGDLARVNTDGEFEYLGRIDQQVKLRGYRIELGEIETLLDKYEHITHSVAQVVKSPAGDDVLAVFLLSPRQIPEPQVLRNYLKGYLPDAMVPAVFVQIDELPLTVSGKLDRKALPNPFANSENGKGLDSNLPLAEDDPISRLWKNTLSITAFEEKSDFFSLGGHSLLAGQLLSRVYDETGVSVSIKEFLSDPFISNLKALVRERQNNGTENHLRPEHLVWENGFRPLSLNQEGIWFLSQLNQNSTEYNISWDIGFNGTTDLTAMKAAISTLFNKHEILKMGFLSNSGKPVGFLESMEDPVIETLDLRINAPDLHEKLIAEFLENEANFKFELSKPPLFRAAVIVEENYALARFTLHHIIADGWSMAVMERELRDLYDLLRQGYAPPEENTEKLTFFDHAAWQRKYLSEEVQAKQIGYWKNKIKLTPASLDMLPDKPQKAGRKSQAGMLFFSLPEAIGTGLEELGKNELATPFTTFLSSFHLLLSKYTGQNVVNVGTVVSNREESYLRDVVGFFVNTIVVTADIDYQKSFREFIGEIRGNVLEGFDNKDVPFDQVVAGVNPERSKGRSPIFQAMFTLQNDWMGNARPLKAPVPKSQPDFVFSCPDEAENSIEIYKYSSNRPAKFDLTLTLQQLDKGYFAVLEFDEEKFADSRMAGLMGNWLVLMKNIIDQPDQPVGLLPMLTGQEIDFFERQKEEAAYPENSGDLITLFRKIVKAFPEKTAVKYEGREFTYDHLDKESSKWAHSLREKGIGPGVTVAVISSRSAKTVQAFLAILKVGASYLPVSPDDPPARNDFILSDSGTKLILIDTKDRKVSKKNKIPAVIMDQLDGDKSLREDSVRSADSVAYLMYTSGSTGMPKGVEVCDRGIIRLACGQDYAVLDENEVFSQISPLTFDASTFEIWASLLNGGTLVIAPRKRMSLAEISEYLRSESITTAFFTTPLFNQLVDDQLEKLGSLRQIITGGDVISLPHARKLLKEQDHIHLVNAYGPTEGSAFTTCYPVKIDQIENADFIPIGYSLKGTTVDLLDDGGQPVPKGAAGEIYIGGEGVAKGYRNRKDLTKSHFIQDAEHPGKRYYRSGDLGRFLEDGSLQFLGRKDSQLKIRGFRIEVGEIESKLNSHPDISRSAVVAVSAQQEKQLVAYIKLVDKNLYLSLPDLRAFLATLIPDYMLPSHYVIVEDFPLTPTGKLDLKQLPEFQFVRNEIFQTPQTKMERLVAFHFEQVLGVRPIGVDGNFFDLGGHSLLATRLLARLRSELELDMPLEIFFDTQTVSAVAKYFEELERQGEKLDFAEVAKIERQSEPPLSFAQQRLWFLEQLYPEKGSYTILSTRVVETLDLDALTYAQNAMIGRHESLRTLFPIGKSGEPFQNVLPASEAKILQLDYSSYSMAEKKTRLSIFLKQEATRKFDLAVGPLFMMTAIRLDHKHSLLAATFHHIVSDGWSMDIFWSEIHDLYLAFSEKTADPLPPLKAQYVDFTYWQREFISGPLLEKQLDYWRGIIGWETPPITKLPVSFPQQDEDDFQSSTLGINLSSKQRSALENLASDEKASLFMILSAAFYTLVYRYTGNRDICIGVPLANRRVREAESMIGFFVNTVPLRVDLSESPSFREVLRRVRERALGAYTNQDVPFEKIVEELHPGRYGAKNAFFDMMFSFQTSSQKGFRLAYHTDEMEPDQSPAVKRGNDAGVAKFSISLSAVTVDDFIEFWLEFKNKSYDEDFIIRFLQNLSVLIDSIISSPDTVIDELPILSQEENKLLVTDWNQRKRPYDRTLSLLDYVEMQVKKTPHSPALINDEYSLTYEEMIVSVNKTAHYLQSIGVKKGDIVALCVNRSIDMILWQMGIMRIGAAYLPIDPAFPVERVKYMLEDSHVSIVMIHDEHKNSIPKGKWKTYSIDKVDGKVAQFPEASPGVAVKGDDVCYVMYTSGSTGRPNGTILEHRGLANCVIWMQDEYRLNADDRVLLKESYCYDATVWETFWPLFNGGAVVVARADKHLDGEYLSDLIYKEKVSVMYFVSSLLPFLYEEMDVKKCGKFLKHVFCGGEALSPKILRRHYSHFNAPLHNWYGPTEASSGTVAWTCETDFTGSAVPIGKPINNVRSYIVDQNRQLVPIGVSGELLLAGISVGKGYLGNESLTAAKIIEDPFTADKELNSEDRRTYRTGDVVRYDKHGNIEYLGRIDNQLKIRGQRIELGEIYSVIEKQPEIKESYVLAKKLDGDQQLVSYVVWNEPTDDSIIPEMRNRIRNEIPEFMVPLIVSIAEMPHMENGKIDPQKLPDAELFSRQDFKTYISPRNPLEEFLAEQFATLLEIDKIGVYDDFFLLGGHSLLAAKLIARLRKAFSLEIPLKSVFIDRNIASLGGRIKNLIGRQTSLEERKPVKKWDWKEELRPLSYEQERMWFLSEMTGYSSAYNVTKIILIDDYADAGMVENCLLRIAERHELLRSVFVDIGGQIFSRVISMDRLQFDFSVEDLREFSASEANTRFNLLCELQFSKEFQMGESPVWRALLVHLPAGNSCLVVNLHHIIFDTNSGEIFNREFRELYQAIKAGGDVEFPALEIQYSDYAKWQRLNSNDFLEDLSYWENELHGMPKKLYFGALENDAAAQTKFDRTEWVVKGEKIDSFRDSCKSASVTSFVAFLALWIITLSRLTKGGAVLTGIPVSMRNRPEIQETIGLFINTIVLLEKVDPKIGFGAYLAALQKKIVSHLSHSEVPYERIVQHVRKNSHGNKRELFDAFFAHETHGEGDDPNVFHWSDGQENRTDYLNPSTAKFPLSLHVLETKETIKLTFEFDKSKITESMAEEIIGMYQSSLNSFSTLPNSRKIEHF